MANPSRKYTKMRLLANESNNVNETSKQNKKYL